VNPNFTPKILLKQKLIAFLHDLPCKKHQAINPLILIKFKKIENIMVIFKVLSPPSLIECNKGGGRNFYELLKN